MSQPLEDMHLHPITLIQTAKPGLTILAHVADVKLLGVIDLQHSRVQQGIKPKIPGTALHLLHEIRVVNCLPSALCFIHLLGHLLNVVLQC
jgi:hypothetical protein